MDPWEKWYRQWRGTELASLVVRLAEVLLARGQCTADDARAVKITGDPRIRGGAMRAICGLGLAVKGEAVNSASETCHHRPIQRFVLRDARACRLLLQRHAAAVLRLEPGECRYRAEGQGQLVMAI